MMPATLPALVPARTLDAAAAYPLPPEEEVSLREHWEALLRYRWSALAVLLAVVASTLVTTLVTVPVYQATTLLEIKGETQKVVAFQDVVQVAQAEREFYQTQYDVLRSRNLAKRVIERLGLTAEPAFNPVDGGVGALARAAGALRSLLTRAPAFEGPAGATRAEQALVDRFLGNVEVTPRRNSHLVEVGFQSPDPALAARVANALASEYVDLVLDQRVEAVKKGRAFIEKQLVVTKAALEHSEVDLQAFATANEILTIDTKQNIEYRKLEDLNQALTHAQHERMAKQSLYRQVGGGDAAALSEIANNAVIARLTGELATREAERARLAATFTPEYPALKRLEAQMGALRRQLERERQTLAAALGADFEAAEKEEALLLEALGAQKRVVSDLNQHAIDYKILKREVDTNRGIYNSLLQRLKEVEVTEGIKASNVQVVDVAEVPVRPVHPRPLLGLALALAIGTLGGAGLALARERLDSSIRTPEDVERHLRVASLGVLPQVHPPRAIGTVRPFLPELTVAEDPRSAAAEALRSVRAALFLSTAAGPPQRIVVSSPRPEEGKTCLAVNLALLLAQFGRRVVLVDCDFRRPRLHRLFGLAGEVGVSSFLAGSASLPPLLHATSHGVDVMPSGPVPPNPVELIDSAPMAALLEELSRRYDFVLLDGPPVLGFADVPLLARQGCGVLFVVRAGVTPRRAAAHASEALRRMGIRVLGAVLNGVRDGGPGYYYASYLSYAPRDGRPPECPGPEDGAGEAPELRIGPA